MLLWMFERVVWSLHAPDFQAQTQEVKLIDAL